jgi:hypothetical protein
MAFRHCFTRAMLAPLAVYAIFLSLACGGGSSSPPPPVPPSITTQPANQTVLEGATATFTVAAAGTAPLSYQWKKDGTAIAGAASASYTTPAAVLADSGSSFTVAVSNAAGSVTSSAATLTVHPNPTIASFTPTPALITAGGSSTLAFSFSGGTGSIDNGVGAVTSGTNVLVAPTTTTTYTLTVDNGFGTTKTSTATVTVAPVPVAPALIVPTTVTTSKAGLTAAVAVPQAGITYSWALSSGTITAGQNTSQITFTAGAVGSATLTCTAANAAGDTAPTSTTLTIVAAPTAGLAASTQAPPYGATNVTVTPTFTGAASAVVGTTAGGSDVSASAVSGTAIAVQASGFTTARTYYLRATNAAGDYQDASVAITPLTVAVSLSPSTKTVTVGAAITFTATVTGAVNTGVNWSTTGGSFASNVWTAPAAAGNYTITATSQADATKSATATITVAPAPVSPSVTAPPDATTGKAGYTASIPAQAGMAYAWTVSSGSITAGQGTTQITFTAGAVGTTTVSCVVTNAAGDSAPAGTATVNVVAAPVATSLTATPASPLYGATVTLTPVFSNGVSATIDQGIGTVLSGNTYTSSPITTATTFTLTVTNLAGDTATATATVTPQAVTISAISGNQNLTVSTSSTYSATVGGAVNTTVSWYVDGVAGGSATAGTITSGGLYTAPASAGTHTIKAVAVADGTTNSTLPVNIYGAPDATITAPPSVPSGATGLTASVPLQSSGTVYGWTITNGTITAGQGTHQITFTAGTVGTLALNCTVTNPAAATTSGNASVSVVAAPVINSFSANPTGVLSGGPVTLSFNFAGGTGSIDNGVGAVTSGVNVTVNPTFTTTYTLTVTPSVGSPATQSVAVTVSTALTFTTDLPVSATVYVGQNYTLSVVVSGTPAPTSYDWYHGATKVTTTSTGSYTITGAQVSDGGSWYVVAGNGITTQQSATLNLAVNSGYTVSGQVTVANGSAPVPGATMTLSGASTATTTTDANGNYTFSGLLNGTYTVTPSISATGVSSWFLPSSQAVTVNGANVTTSFQADIGFSVSGTVVYPGSKTGRIYLALNGNGAANGVSIPAPASYPASFTIRGVPPGNYTLSAYMDTLGLGNANANDPGPSTTISFSVGNVPVSGLTVNLVDPSTPTLTAPSFQGVVPFSKGALVNYAPILGTGMLELATSYDVQWSTSSSFASIAGTLNFTAQGANNPMCFLSGLTDGTLYYLRIRGNVLAVNGPWSATSTLTPNATSGAYTVTGTVSLPAGVAATGPLAVALVDDVNKRYYITSFASPGASNAYTLSGVVAGSYKLFGILDQNHNGVIDPGDITNTNGNGLPVTVAANLAGQDLPLSNAASTAQLTTQHWKQSGAYTGEGYNLNFRVNGNVKLPVNFTLQLGANGTFDVGVNSNGGDRYQYWVNSLRPTVGDSYPVTVAYSDGTSETQTPAVTAVLDSFAQNLSPTTTGSGVTTPTFTWAAPLNPPAAYTYDLWIASQMGQLWSYWGMPSSQLSVIYNVDNSASQPTLTQGTLYNWSVGVTDAQGNSAQMQVNYQP